MWVAIGMVAVVVLMIAMLSRTPSSSDDGPLPPDIEAQVLLGEDPERPVGDPASDEDERRR